MGAKRILAVRHRKKKLIRFLLLAALVAAAVFFVKERKDFLVHQAKASLEALLSRESDFEVHIGKVSGRFLGEIRFDGVEVLTPGAGPESERLFFRAKEISVRYRLLDFLSKEFNSKISVLVQDPEVYCRQKVRVSHRSDFPFFSWMRQWALARRDIIGVRVNGMNVLFPSQKYKLEGINLSYEDNKLKAEIPLRHIGFGTMDISTVINAEGDFHLGFFGAEDSIEGEIHTEGTVVNWSPLPQESEFHFSFSRSKFQLTSADLLGGIQIQGNVDFQKDYHMRWDIDARDYKLSNLDFLLKTTPKSLLPSRFDLDLHFEGSPFSPSVEGSTRIYDGYIGHKTFKAMDLQIEGVYPTVKLENSRILLSDETVMRFADTTLEFRELFRAKTYVRLVTEAQQDTVVWGDWEFRRPQDGSDKTQFLLQRTLGDRAKLNFRDYKRDDSPIAQPNDSDRVEASLEYKLFGKNSLKLGLRDDEKFVGVERKVKF